MLTVTKVTIDRGNPLQSATPLELTIGLHFFKTWSRRSLTLFPSHTQLTLAVFLPISSIPLFPRLIIYFLHAFVTLPVPCPFFPLCFTAGQQPGILFFPLQDLCSSSPCCWLRDLMQKPSTAFRTLDNLRHLVLMHFLRLFFLISFSSPPTN